MSGGSYDYIYSKLSSECEGEMHDPEMDDLIKDLCDVLHDLEWWQSGDYSENTYRETVSEFKKKWLKGDRTNRLKGYIDDQIDTVRHQLYSLIGEEGDQEGTPEWIIREDNKKFIKENFEPVEDKPGYVWFNKRDSLIISIETFAKLLEKTWARIVYNLPLEEKENEK